MSSLYANCLSAGSLSCLVAPCSCDAHAELWVGTQDATAVSVVRSDRCPLWWCWNTRKRCSLPESRREDNSVLHPASSLESDIFIHLFFIGITITTQATSCTLRWCLHVQQHLRPADMIINHQSHKVFFSYFPNTIRPELHVNIHSGTYKETWHLKIWACGTVMSAVGHVCREAVKRTVNLKEPPPSGFIQVKASITQIIQH